jgi:CubicO group peptidase (beta-lactamase class C family)
MNEKTQTAEEAGSGDSGVQVRGEVAQGYEKVKQVFAGLHAKGWEVGSAFTVLHAPSGRVLVNLTAGFTNVPTEEVPKPAPFDDRTLLLVASCTKFAESLCMALLVDRGLISYDDRIAKHWPEFGQKGKEHITIRQLMMHQAGLAAPERKLNEKILDDPDDLAQFFAAHELCWPVRDESSGWDQHTTDPPPQGYHAVTRGLIASEICRRVDPKRRRIGTFLREEICEPLGIEFYIGLPEEHEDRVSKLISTAPGIMLGVVGMPVPPQLAVEYDPADPRYQLTDSELAFLKKLMDPSSLINRALFCNEISGVRQDQIANHRLIRAVEMPSSNGVTNTYSMAVLAALSHNKGKFNGQKIFEHGEETFAQAIQVADRYSVDLIMQTPVRFTQAGWARFNARDQHQTESIGWGGAGGTMIRFVPELGLAVAYATNKLGIRMAMNDPRPNILLETSIECARNLGVSLE